MVRMLLIVIAIILGFWLLGAVIGLAGRLLHVLIITVLLVLVLRALTSSRSR